MSTTQGWTHAFPTLADDLAVLGTGYLVKQKITARQRCAFRLSSCSSRCTPAISAPAAGPDSARGTRSTIRDKLSVEDCLASADECGTPIVAVCGRQNR